MKALKHYLELPIDEISDAISLDVTRQAEDETDRFLHIRGYDGISDKDVPYHLYTEARLMALAGVWGALQQNLVLALQLIASKRNEGI